MRLFHGGLAWLGLIMAFALGCGSAENSARNAAPASPVAQALPKVELLNVSYDPTREFYQAYNKAFAAHWLSEKQQVVEVQQSHGGSGKQARAVIDGLEADVVTLALGYDIDAIATRSKLVNADWRGRLPRNSAPYTSTIVFLVRKGNPKQIKQWQDLNQGDISLVAANPKTGGGARWNYLAAWGAVLHQELNGDWNKLHDPAAKAEVDAAQAKAREFVGGVYRRMKVLDSGARGATTSFVQNGLGDVLLAWENEAYLILKEFGADQVEIVVPPVSILAEPAVTLVDKTVDKHGTREVAEAYLLWLFSPTGQRLAAQFHYRPALPELVDPPALAQFTQVKLFTIDEAFGGWPIAQKTHFDDGGIFDQIYAAQK
ncbi:MAG TPA: sulfate ABC transporter substrate-binding protein [Pirellulaceae bacterium]|nr:sulfate ABC transporter substrate-binding protein [Pirellulaceae bacterium]